MKSVNLHQAKIFFKCDNLNHFYHILVTKRDFFFLSNFFSVIADYSYQVIIIVELQLQTSLDLYCLLSNIFEKPSKKSRIPALLTLKNPL